MLKFVIYKTRVQIKNKCILGRGGEKANHSHSISDKKVKKPLPRGRPDKEKWKLWGGTIWIRSV